MAMARVWVFLMVLCIPVVALAADELPAAVKTLPVDARRLWLASADELRQETYVKAGNIEVLPDDVRPLLDKMLNYEAAARARRIGAIDAEIARIKQQLEGLRWGAPSEQRQLGARRRPLQTRKYELERERRDLVKAQTAGSRGEGVQRPTGGMPLELVDEAVGTVSEIRVRQVVDDDEMLADYLGQPVWIRGLTTKGVVDGSVVPVLDTMRVSGTKRYGTVVGSTKTVFIVERFELKPYLKPPTYSDVAKLLTENNVKVEELPQQMSLARRANPSKVAVAFLSIVKAGGRAAS